MSTEHDALLAAVLADPADDLARLLYADWCGDNGRLEQAEFIRVQVEISKVEVGDPDMTCGHAEPCTCEVHKRRESLRGLERKLWAGNWVRRLAAATLDQSAPRVERGDVCLSVRRPAVTARFRRGFAAEVSCPLWVWIGRESTPCGGAGIGPALVRRQPIEFVDVTDRETEWFDGEHWWNRGGVGDSVLPEDVFDLLPAGNYTADGSRIWRSRSTARYALSAAVLAWAKARPA